MDDFFARNLIRDASDLYKLRVDDLCGADRSRERSARRTIEGIAESRNVPFDRVLFALGIRFVGRVAAKSLATHFTSFENLRKASFDEFLQVDGIGLTIAGSLRAYLMNEQNISFVNRLAQAGVQMEMTTTKKESTKLDGATIVISGTFNLHSREEYKALIEAHGGKNTGSISKKQPSCSQVVI